MRRLHPCAGTVVLSPTAPIAVFRCSPDAQSCTCAADALRYVWTALYAADDPTAHPAWCWWVRREIDGADLSASRRGEGVLRRVQRGRAALVAAERRAS